jgi:PAS domain S-box-containing protein
MTSAQIIEALQAENAELRGRLQGAEELIAAIRGHAVDAFLVEQPRGERVYMLQGADAPYRRMVECMQEGALTLAADGMILSCNARMAELLGTRPADLIGRRPDGYVAERERPALLALLDNGLRDLQRGESVLLHTNGSEVPVQLIVTALDPTSGAALCAVISDLTERRRDEILQRSQATMLERLAEFRAIADSAPVLIWVNDTTGCVYANRAYLDFLGLDLDTEVRGNDWARFVHPDDREAYVQKWQDCLARRAPFAAEFRFRHRDGEYRWMQSIGTPRFADSGALLCYTGCTYDIHDVRTAAAALRDADRRKDEFLAVLAHELRNPLAPLRNGLHIAKLTLAAASPLQQTVGMMERQLNHLVRLVDDLLDVNRINRGKVELRLAPLRLNEVLAQSIESCRHVIEAHGHTLTVDVNAESVMVEGDAHRLAQVFSNLLLNSTKYTQDGGTIHLSLEQEGAAALVRVRDNGMGIRPEDIDRVFEMFAQVTKPEGRTDGGLGVGLFLVRALVTMHGGTVSVASQGLGKGSTFTVRLPLANASQGMDGSATPSAQAPSGSLRILVVDDSRDGAESLATLLRYGGHRVLVAHDGFEAIEQARANAFDLVFMDIAMPGLDGIEAASRIRALAGHRDTNIVALTGWGQERDRERTRTVGIEMHLVKPIQPDAINAVLAKLCGPGSPRAATSRRGAT